MSYRLMVSDAEKPLEFFPYYETFVHPDKDMVIAEACRQFGMMWRRVRVFDAETGELVFSRGSDEVEPIRNVFVEDMQRPKRRRSFIEWLMGVKP